MNESKLPKPRQCRACRRVVHGTAADLTSHAKLCRIAERSGLILPGGLVTPEEAERQAEIVQRAVQKRKGRAPGMGGGLRG